VVTRTKGHMGWDEPVKRFDEHTCRTMAGAWGSPDRTEVTGGKQDWRCFQKPWPL